ncbi:MAG: sigma-70 family RNA polymerase sigma factor, partial [Prevotellaceae bacterium]|nr:sigma-70 family RNA polymerase sigma factor [Prevotellaceae bacterium]
MLQQTFISAWNNISILEDNSAFNTWIQRITLNQCYSLMRKSKPAISIDDKNENCGVFELESDFLLPEVYAQQEDLKVRLGNIVAQLSDVQRQTIQLFYFDEMTVDEIANVMDCSIGTVKSRLFLARKAIRTEIEETERKTGSKFYGVTGIPMLAFGKMFSLQAKGASLQASSAISSYSKITAEIFGTAKNIVIEATNEVIKGIEKASTKAAENTVAQSVTNVAKGQTNKFAKKGISAIVKNIGGRIAATFVSAGVLCGSLFGSFSNVSAAKVSVPKSNDTTRYSAAYAAYIDLLKGEQSFVDSYTWQKGHYGNDDYWNNDEPKPIVLADVYGDVTPELIYVSTDETYSAQTNLHILTYQENSITELYKGDWDHNAGGGFSYYLFQNDNDKSLNAYTSTGDEAWTIAYSRFVEENGKLVKKDYLKYYTYPDQESIANGNYRKIDEYTSDDKKIDKSKYESQERKIIDKTKSVLMYSSGIPGRIPE